MNHNDVIRRLRYALNITDLKVIELFALAGRTMTRAELEPYFLKEEEPGYVECPDEVLGLFLDGLIVSRRGPREEKAGAATHAGATVDAAADGKARVSAKPTIPDRLSNNEILRRLKIALELRDEDLVAIMGLAEVKVSKSEFSAFFRKFGHPNWRPCGDQFLRNFLAGLTAKSRV